MPKSQPSEMQIYEFGKLPLVYEGRVKPYDTLARNSLQILSGRQELATINNKGEVVSREPAIRWLLDVISDADGASDERVFRIENLDLLNTLGLAPRPQFWRYSYNEITSKKADRPHRIRKLRRSWGGKLNLSMKRRKKLVRSIRRRSWS